VAQQRKLRKYTAGQLLPLCDKVSSSNDCRVCKNRSDPSAEICACSSVCSNIVCSSTGHSLCLSWGCHPRLSTCHTSSHRNANHNAVRAATMR
jgi:hypothetical protein